MSGDGRDILINSTCKANERRGVLMMMLVLNFNRRYVAFSTYQLVPSQHEMRRIDRKEDEDEEKGGRKNIPRSKLS